MRQVQKSIDLAWDALYLLLPAGARAYEADQMKPTNRLNAIFKKFKPLPSTTDKELEQASCIRVTWWSLLLTAHLQGDPRPEGAIPAVQEPIPVKLEEGSSDYEKGECVLGQGLG